VIGLRIVQEGSSAPGSKSGRIPIIGPIRWDSVCGFGVRLMVKCPSSVRHTGVIYALARG